MPLPMLSLMHIIHARVEILTIYGETSAVLCSTGNHCPNNRRKTTPGNYLTNILKILFYHEVFLKKYIQKYFVKFSVGSEL